MATINTANIEGFETMSADEKVNALLNVDIPEAVDMSRYVEKSLLDKKLSELAKANDIIKQNVSEEAQNKLEQERIKAENDAKYAELESKYNALIKKSTISEYKAKFLAQGYDDKLAHSTADALANGEMDKVFSNSQQFYKILENKIKADIMASNPMPSNGVGMSENNTDNSNIELAKKIGKEKAANNQKAAEILKNYF